jgi:WD40 repeat protein
MASTDDDDDYLVNDPGNAFQSTTFEQDIQIKIKENVGSASISPSSRDVVLAGRDGLLIIDLDAPYSPPRRLVHHSRWDVADVQWSPFPSRDYWIVSTSNQKALVWNLDQFSAHEPIQYILHAHSRAITDINFSNHDPDMLATCAVDSFVHCWDLRHTVKPAMSFADWNAGATQVKWNRQDPNIIASSHDKFLKIWDKRKGAFPLKTIDAHTTKIYGLDWNETRPTGIVTCSLDRTIKFWDYNNAFDEPERIIRTDFPVWRARYTPFGWGLLAMPQRSDYSLHLYDRRLQEGEAQDGHPDPVASFAGHENNVREFLWRFRGSIDNDIDNRDFQLVSWGSDNYLRLNRMDADSLQKVGYEKGKLARKAFNVTRLGAAYTTWRTEGYSEDGDLDYPENRAFRPQPGGLAKAFGAGASTMGFLPLSLGLYASRRNAKANSDMKWIENVKVSQKTDPTRPLFGGQSIGTQENLSEEMTYVSKRYKKVEFDKADVHERTATVSLNGPWAPDGKSVYLRLTFTFPSQYPMRASPTVHFDRTHFGTANDEQILQKLRNEVDSITAHYEKRQRGSLEAVITYLLGERSMEQSLILKPHDGLEATAWADDDTSDEEDEDQSLIVRDLEGSASILPPQANVPVARLCGALWGADGQLVCFFPPKPEPVPIFTLNDLRKGEKGRDLPRQFEGFGRWRDESLDKDKEQDSSDEQGNSSSQSPSESPSSSSDESDDASHLPLRFKPPKAWRTAVLRNQKPSSHSSSNPTRMAIPEKIKSSVYSWDFSEFLPAKKVLAEEYRIFGEGPVVCDHNAAVATRHGQYTTAAVWEFCKQILYDDVPLDRIDYKRRNEPILVIARRNAVRIKRKDSGLDLGFDEPDTVIRPRLTGRVRWGKHPFSSSWLIPELFNHYEKEADIQMLAMLACIFCEPAVQKDVYNALQFLDPEDLPVSLKAPAFSLNYHPNRDVAVSIQERRYIPRPPPPTITQPQMDDYFTRQAANYGSLGSSNGVASTEHGISEPATPFSPGEPTPVIKPTPTGQSLSTSPDPATIRTTRRSTSTLSNALASLSRGLTMTLSSSPPTAKLEADISTSAPSNGVPWPVHTSFGSTSPHSPVQKRKPGVRTASFATHEPIFYSDDDHDSDTDEDESLTLQHSSGAGASTPSYAQHVRITFKNQRQFDDEGFSVVPLLDTSASRRWTTYRAIYATLLSRWQLYIRQSEILQFNGMPSIQGLPTPPPDVPSHGSVTFALTQSQPSAHVHAQFIKPLINFNPVLPISPRLTATGANSLNPSATPFIPQPPALGGGIRRTERNAPLQQFTAQGHGIISIPRSSTPPLRPSDRLDLGTAHHHGGGAKYGLQSTLLAKATNFARGAATPGLGPMGLTPSNTSSGGGAGGKKDGVKGKDRACVVCWEFVVGLYLVCGSGQHRAHMGCVKGREPEATRSVFGRGIGCGCDDEDDLDEVAVVDNREGAVVSLGKVT